jgi:hypothetical protein
MGVAASVLTGIDWLVLALVWSCSLLLLGLLGLTVRRAQNRTGSSAGSWARSRTGTSCRAW